MELLGTYIPNTPKKLFIGEKIKNILLPNSLYSNLKTGEDWNLVLSAWNKMYSMDIIRKCGWSFASEREIISEDFYSLTELYGQLNSVFILVGIEAQFAGLPCLFSEGVPKEVQFR